MKAVFMQICDKKLGSWVCWPMKTTAPASFLYTSSIREGWKTRQHKVCWEDGLACNRDKTSQSIFRHRGRWLEAIKLDYANVFISGHKAKPPYSYSTAKIYIAARLKFTKKCVSHQTTFFHKRPSKAAIMLLLFSCLHPEFIFEFSAVKFVFLFSTERVKLLVYCTTSL